MAPAVRTLACMVAAAAWIGGTLSCAPQDSTQRFADTQERASGSEKADAARPVAARDDDGDGFSLFGRSRKVELPAGTAISVRLSDTVDSESATEGQSVSATVTSDVAVDGKVVVPSGSRVTGRVSEVRPARRFGGQSYVAVTFTEVETPDGDDIPVEGRLEDSGKKQVGKDTATIAGSAVGGAILGEILDDKPIEGAVVGGGIGTAVASRRGEEAVIPAGREVTVRTTGTVDVRASR
jgi:hypothetical protein